jgi:hypothetical protein
VDVGPTAGLAVEPFQLDDPHASVQDGRSHLERADELGSQLELGLGNDGRVHPEGAANDLVDLRLERRDIIATERAHAEVDPGPLGGDLRAADEATEALVRHGVHHVEQAVVPHQRKPARPVQCAVDRLVRGDLNPGLVPDPTLLVLSHPGDCKHPPRPG